jgi:predicted dehydrogenase
VRCLCRGFNQRWRYWTGHPGSGFWPASPVGVRPPRLVLRTEQYGGILCDIGSHQVEQFLSYSGAANAEVRYAAIANYNHPEYPELEDFGEANLVADNGCSNYFRVDWFTPDGLSTWGDGRTIILGTDGYIELRKYTDIARDQAGDQLYLVNQEGERHSLWPEKSAILLWPAN